MRQNTGEEERVQEYYRYVGHWPSPIQIKRGKRVNGRGVSQGRNSGAKGEDVAQCGHRREHLLEMDPDTSVNSAQGEDLKRGGYEKI